MESFVKTLILIFMFISISFCQNFDPYTGKPIINKEEQSLEKKEDCYYDGMYAAKSDFSGKGVLPGLGCGIFGFIGWGVGTVAYAMQKPETPYIYLKDLDGDCKFDFDQGYRTEGKKLRNKNFHMVAGGVSVLFLVINLGSL